MEERRVFTRINARVPVRFLDLSSGREGQAETLNISGNGLGLVTNDDLSTLTPLVIWLNIPDEYEPLCVRGRVAWSEPLSGRVGVHLENAGLLGLGRVLRLKRRNGR